MSPDSSGDIVGHTSESTASSQVGGPMILNSTLRCVIGTIIFTLSIIRIFEMIFVLFTSLYTGNFWQFLWPSTSSTSQYRLLAHLPERSQPKFLKIHPPLPPELVFQHPDEDDAGTGVIEAANDPLRSGQLVLNLLYGPGGRS